MRPTFPLGLIAGLLLSAGCKDDPAAHVSSVVANAAAGAVVATRSPRDLVAASASRLPASADVVFAADLGPWIRSAFEEGLMGLVPPAEDPAAFRADLGRVYARFFGVDPTGAESVVGFATIADQAVALIVAGDFGTPSPQAEMVTVAGKQAVEIEPDLFFVLEKGGLLVGNRSGLEALAGDGPRLEGAVLAAHLAGLDRVGVAAAAVTGAVPAVLLTAATEGSPLQGIEIARISSALGTSEGGVRLALEGDDNSRERIAGFINLGLVTARSFLDQAEKEIDTSDDMEKAMMGVMARHLGKGLLAMPQVENADGVLSLELSLGAQPGVQAMWITGVASAIAIPAFVKYQKRARAVRDGYELEHEAIE